MSDASGADRHDSGRDFEASAPSVAPAAPLALVALGLGAVLILLAMLQQMGLPEAVLAAAATGLPLAAVVLAGLSAPAQDGAAFHRGQGAFGGSVGGLSAASAVAVLPTFSGLGARAFEAGYDGLWPGLGLSLGFVLSGVLLAPRIARAGAVLCPARFGAGVRALLSAAAAMLMIMSLAAGLASFSAAGSALVGLPADTVLAAAAALVVLMVLPGGLRSTTWAQAVAGVVVIVAVTVLAGVLSWDRSRNPLAMLTYGEALGEVGRLEVALIGQKLADGASLKRHAVPYIGIDALNYLGAALTTALGLAAFPLLTERATAVPSPQAARGIMAGGLLALLPVMVLLPAIAVFAKLELLTLIAKPTPVAGLPGWMYELGQFKALKVCGAEPVSAESVAAACGGISGHKGLLRLQDVRLDADLAWLAAPRIGGAPAFLHGLAVAGLGAALLAMCAGAAFVGGKALAPGLAPARSGQRAASAALTRGAVLAVVAAAVLAAKLDARETVALAEWILPLSAVALFVPLLLGLCWRRATGFGVAAGMLGGLAVSLYYLVAGRYWPVEFVDSWGAWSNAAPSAPRKLEQLRAVWASAGAEEKPAAYLALQAHARGMASWFGVRPTAAGVFGVPTGLLLGLLGSLLTRPRAAAEPDRQAS